MLQGHCDVILNNFSQLDDPRLEINKKHNFLEWFLLVFLFFRYKNFYPIIYQHTKSNIFFAGQN